MTISNEEYFILRTQVAVQFGLATALSSTGVGILKVDTDKALENADKFLAACDITCSDTIRAEFGDKP